METKLSQFYEIRKATEAICNDLSDEVLKTQPRAEVSPPIWHLGHTTWFFEKFLLDKRIKNYKSFNSKFNLYFNSYYKGVGDHWLQGERSKIPYDIDEVFAYRNHVDSLIDLTLDDSSLLTVGLHHEEQHQELLHMDIKSILHENCITYDLLKSERIELEKTWSDFSEGLYQIGTSGEEFYYDNEGPNHKYYLYAFEVRDQLVTNSEYQGFIESGGYQNSKYWLSKGWDWVEANSVRQPMFWSKDLHPDAPVAHITYFEADAYAQWAGCRLPTEYEHEVFDKKYDQQSTLWAWTSSQYSAYPNYKKFAGDLVEYNGKFMCNQFVLRGGCIATPKNHWRTTYRNFYEPHQSWMYSGIRLARNKK